MKRVPSCLCPPFSSLGRRKRVSFIIDYQIRGGEEKPTDISAGLSRYIGRAEANGAGGS